MGVGVDTTSSSHEIAGEPSVTTALERLVVASQGVITKRIDLALLEGEELLSRTLRLVAFASIGMMLATAAWFALLAALIEWLFPDQSRALHLALFGLANLSAGGGLIGVGLRPLRRPAPNSGIVHPHEIGGRKVAS